MQKPGITKVITVEKNNAPKITNLIPHASQSYRATLKIGNTQLYCTKHHIWI
jgi:hypothetical protein